MLNEEMLAEIEEINCDLLEIYDTLRVYI